MTLAVEKPSIRAIAFDWGGVICEDPAPGFKKLLSIRFKCSQEELAPHLLASMDDFQRGLVSEEDFLTKLAEKLQRPKNKQLFWKDALRTVYRENRAVLDLIRGLKMQGYAIGLLSNTEAPAREFHLECNYDFFDARIFSCEEGIVKPEREIYALTAKRLRVSHNELLLVDDKQENIEGAIAAGVFGILYVNPQHLASELGFYGIA